MTDLSRQQERGGMGAEQTKEGADVVQELEDMDVLAVVRIYQPVISASYRSKDGGHLQSTISLLSSLYFHNSSGCVHACSSRCCNASNFPKIASCS